MWSKTATVSTSASTARRRRAGWGLPLAALLACAPSSVAVAGPKLETFQGHAAVGYGKLFAEDSPGGSISVAGGIEYPLRSNWSAGVEIGYWLLGTRLVERDSVGAELDYSVFEATALARWKSSRSPLEIAAGPGLFHAVSDLTSSGAAGFGDLAGEATVVGAALGITVIQTRPSPVRVGLDLSMRALWLPSEFGTSPMVAGMRMPTWTLVGVRLAIHY